MFEISGTYGKLVIDGTGAYTYTSTPTNDDIPADAEDVFVYTIEDGDGDRITTTLTIDVSESLFDISYADLETSDVLVGENGTDSDTNTVTVSGQVAPVTYSLQGADGDGNVVVADGVFSIDSNSGAITFTQNAAYTHDASGPEDDLEDDAYTVTVLAEDSLGNTDSAVVNVDITDDLPCLLYTSDAADD